MIHQTTVATADTEVEDRSMRVVERLMAKLGQHNFNLPVQIDVGAACYPMHAMGAESLK